MNHLLVRHRVADVEAWMRIFESHAEAQSEAGLRAEHVFRNVEDPNELFLLFEVRDIDEARRFMATPDAGAAKRESGVLDEPDVYFLR